MNYCERIRAAIDFIEDHLSEEISVASVAAQIGFSEYHFHRIFQGMLGESVAAYIRKRRISEAAGRLECSERSILDLALESGFETQESFSRAFKRMFGVSPNQYRRQSAKGTSYRKGRTTKAMIDHLQKGITLTPRFEVKGPVLVVGLAGSFSTGCQSEIEQLWAEFVRRQPEIEGRVAGTAYGVCLASHDKVPIKDGATFVYMAGSPVSELGRLPPGMVSCVIPRAKYAVFTHNGSLDALPHTIDYIWGTWIPGNLNEYKQSSGPDFELYGERFDPETRSGEFDICIPVETDEPLD
jgi:AraC family transcriptional regulator